VRAVVGVGETPRDGERARVRELAPRTAPAAAGCTRAGEDVGAAGEGERGGAGAGRALGRRGRRGGGGDSSVLGHA